MCREAYLNQLVAGDRLPAGKVFDRQLLSAWMQALPRNAYPHAAGLLKNGVAKSLDKLEANVVDAFLAHVPDAVQRPHVEALLLAVLGRDPDADALGFADALPLPASRNGQVSQPVTILERAIKVGQRDWESWTKGRRRREYLLLEFYDAVLADPAEIGRNERVTEALRLLAKERQAV